MLIGYTPGLGAAELHGGQDVVGWQHAHSHIGPSATETSVVGQPFARVTKLFDQRSGYPDFPRVWGGAAKELCANNGGVPLLPILCFEDVPTAAKIQAFLASLPSGQKCAFQYRNEPENSTTSPTAFITGWGATSDNLNAALRNLGRERGNLSWWSRNNFPMIMSSRLDYYRQHHINTDYLPPRDKVQIYGADFYQHLGTGTTLHVGAERDMRFQYWLDSVRHRVGTSTPIIGCPEYGIGFATYTAANEAARASLLSRDLTYFKSLPDFRLLSYWYQMVATPNLYCFPHQNGTETQAQAWPTIKVWQRFVAQEGMK